MNLVAVLVRPVAGDPGGLLAEGLGAVRPSSALAPFPVETLDKMGLGYWEREKFGQWRLADGQLGIVPEYDALPLWWNGALVQDGWRRALDALEFILHETDAQMRERVGAFPDKRGVNPFAILAWKRIADPSLDEVLLASQALVRAGRAERAIYLKRDLGRLVEVAP